MKNILKYSEFLLENSKFTSKDIVPFLKDKKFSNPKSKMFLYHGTSIHPSIFTIRDDYDFEDSNGWSGDLPEGYLFLTTSIEEAVSYGQYVIPCELESYDHIDFRVYTDNPSRAFDMDYGIDLYKPDEYVGFWDSYEESGKTSLIIKGNNNKWTVITPTFNIIPRTDLAIEFYKNII